jgi:hypothetical protein
VAFGRCRKCRGGTPSGERATLRARRAPPGTEVGYASVGVPLPFFVCRVGRAKRNPPQAVEQHRAEDRSHHRLGHDAIGLRGSFRKWRRHNSGARASRERRSIACLHVVGAALVAARGLHRQRRAAGTHKGCPYGACCDAVMLKMPPRFTYLLSSSSSELRPGNPACRHRRRRGAGLRRRRCSGNRNSAA